jgi:class 3 adenylate cyclase
MARLRTSERAALPDRAFAYIDSTGRRRLPIHDESHVRSALGRFGRVEFEDDAARERARERVLRAAKRYRIVPVGFITNELQSERRLGGKRDRRQLPSGFVTMLMTDIEGSTQLVHQLGAEYGAMLDGICVTLRRNILQLGGHEVESRADEFFAAFEVPRAAVDAAAAIQNELAGRMWTDHDPVRIRIGIHSGYPTSTEDNYLGIDVNTASRVCAAGHGGQIVVTANTREAVKATSPAGVRFVSLGDHRLRGLPAAVPLYQVNVKGLPARFPPLRVSKRSVS